MDLEDFARASSSAIRAESAALLGSAAGSRSGLLPDQRAGRRQRGDHIRPDAVVRRPEPARMARERGGPSRRRRAVPHERATGHPPAPGFPRLCRPGGERLHPAGRRGADRTRRNGSPREAHRHFDGDLDAAVAPMSVTLELDREVDVSRGDWIAAAGHSLSKAQRIPGHAGVDERAAGARRCFVSAAAWHSRYAGPAYLRQGSSGRRAARTCGHGAGLE